MDSLAQPHALPFSGPSRFDDLDHIATLEDVAAAIVSPGGHTMQAWCCYLRGMAGKSLPPASFVAQGKPVQAYVNHGRWVAQCPYCPSAHCVSKFDAVFWCVECAMRVNGGAPCAVVFPAMWADVEAELMKRPMAANRNWYPGETPEGLQSENKAHGIGVY